MHNMCMTTAATGEDPLLAYESPDGLWRVLFVESTWEVHLGPHVIERFKLGDTVREWLGIVRLVEGGLLSLRQAAGIFGLSSSRVEQLVGAFRQQGVLGLFPKHKGRRMKISVRARALLIDLVMNRGMPVWHAAVRVKAEIGEYISERTGYGILQMARAGIGAEQQVWGTPEMEAKLAAFDPDLDGAERFLLEASETTQDKADGGSDAATASCSAPEPAKLAADAADTDVEADVTAATTTAADTAPSLPSQLGADTAFEPAAAGREQDYLEKLSQGARVPYLGGLLVAGLLGQLGLAKIFRQLAVGVNTPRDGKRTDNRFWDLPRVLMTLVYAYLFRFHSIESLKTADQESLGLLLGAPQAPYVQTVRDWLLEAAKSRIGESLRWMLARGYAALGWVRLGTLYIDGHFRPYYGSSKIAYGWFAGRNCGHPGSYAYFVNDERGRPVFLELTPASVSFGKILPKLVADAKRLRREAKATGPLVVVVDRGAYSKELFTHLGEQQVVFVTWMKNPPRFAAGYFAQRISVELSKTHRTFWYFTTRVKVTGYADAVKAFALYDPQTGNQMVAITNANRVRPDGRRIRLNDDLLIRLLVKRWVQENFFKSGKQKLSIDQHAGYLFEDEAPDTEVVHPVRKQLTAAIQQLEAQLAPINEALAALQVPRPSSASRRTRGAPRRGSSAEQLRAQRRRLLAKLAQSKEQMRQLPTHIRHAELPADQKRLVARFDKQTILEHLKCAAYNATEMLLEQFSRHCYFERRDPRPILHAIFTQPSFCQLRDGHLYVYPRPFAVPRYEAAAQRLYDILNDEGARTLDAHGFPIHIDTGPQRDLITW